MMDDLDKLIQTVLDPEQKDIKAFLELSKMSDPYITNTLISALSNPDGRVRYKAIWSLQQTHDNTAVQPIIQCLRDTDPEVRWSAADVLGYFHDERAVLPLIQALKDPELNVRGAAVMALGQLKDPRAVEALIMVAPDVTEPALEALVVIGDNRAVEPLIALLRDEISKRDDPLRIRPRRKIIEALGDFRDARAVDVLIACLNDWAGEGLRTTEFEDTDGVVFPSIGHYAAKALEKIGTPEALATVQKWRTTPYPNGGLRSQ